jgi:hypothetical protein
MYWPSLARMISQDLEASLAFSVMWFIMISQASLAQSFLRNLNTSWWSSSKFLCKFSQTINLSHIFSTAQGLKAALKLLGWGGLDIWFNTLHLMPSCYSLHLLCLMLLSIVPVVIEYAHNASYLSRCMQGFYGLFLSLHLEWLCV